jgi:hypothetical protein
VTVVSGSEPTGVRREPTATAQESAEEARRAQSKRETQDDRDQA